MEVGLVLVLDHLQCSSAGTAVLPAASLAAGLVRDMLLVEAHTRPAVVHTVAVHMQAGQVVGVGFGSSHHHIAAAGASHMTAVAVAPAVVPDTHSLQSAERHQVVDLRAQSLRLLQNRMLALHKHASSCLLLWELMQLDLVARNLHLVLQDQADHLNKAVAGSPC